MTQKNISPRVVQVIMDRLQLPEEDVTPEANIKDDLGADSLDVLEIIMELEQEFSITIPDEISDQITTVNSAIKCVEERAGGKQ